MFWQGKRVFVTSPTSFVGAWVCQSLQFLGAQVFGFGEASSESSSFFDSVNLAQKISMTFGDLRDEKSLRDALDFAQADIILHLGEMGFLFDEDRKTPELFAKSVVGTSLLLEILRDTASVRSVVVASSDKVYLRNADGEAFKESDAVGALGVLPTARLCAELVALSYRQSFFNPEKYNKHKIAIATARMGSPIGGGDFAAKSFLYEAVVAARDGVEMPLRNPQSLRPWVHVLDQVNGILLLAQKLYERGPKLSPSYNMGAASTATVSAVAEMVRESWSGQEAKPRGSLAENEATSIHNNIDSTLALHDLQWQPRLSLQESVELSVAWYKAYFNGSTIKESERQLAFFFKGL